MNISITEVIPRTSERYPYSHRVQVDLGEGYKVAEWLDENKIPHTRMGSIVFYLNKENTAWLLLRWS